MSDEQLRRELEAVIRYDGRGEVREGGRATPMTAEDSDELRALVMQHVITIAETEQGPVGLRTIDVDGVYHLVVHPDGDIAEEGGVDPLEDGDHDLVSDAAGAAAQHNVHHDGGYAAMFGDDPEQGDDGAGVHETIQLPRVGMMSTATELIPVQQPAATVPAAPAASATAEAHADDGVDLDELFDEFHDEGLDDDEVADEPASTRDDHDDTSDEEGDGPEAWAPSFPRTRGDATSATDRDGRPQPVPGQLPGQAPQGARPEFVSPFQQPGRFSQSSPNRGGETPPFHPAQQASHGHPLDGGEGDGALGHAGPNTPQVLDPSIAGGPTLGDFLADRSAPSTLPAERGWRASIRRTTGGLISLGPGARERAERSEIASIQRTFDGPKTIVVVNPKGGAHKTTATLMIAATFGVHRGGYTLAWDNNETRGTLGWRSKRGAHQRTAVDLLRQLSHFEISGGATIADVDRFVRNQGESKFDVLASDDDAASAAIIDAEAFSRLHRTLSRFYRVLVIDTGNNMRASNWEAALDVADQLVIVSTAREDTAASAAWLADGLRERGHSDMLANAVTILSSPSTKEDPQLTERLRQHFSRLTRAVVEVPYDEEFVGGGELDIPRLHPETLAAWRRAAAVIAQGL